MGTRDIIILAVLAFSAITFFAVSQTSSAAARDCDSNAILYCGAYSVSELTQKYNSADSKARQAYDYFGVRQSDFGQLVNGYVTKSGTVVVNGQTVASGVLSTGRHATPNSVRIPGGAYVRPPSDSFLSNSIPAYVMMEGDRFLYAIIKSCGNPVGTGNLDRTTITQAKTSAPSPGSEVAPGETIHYQMTVKNTSSITAQTVSLADAIPANTTYVNNSFQTISGTPQPDLFDFDGRRILAAWHRVPAGAERTIKFRVTVNGNVADGTRICNSATADAIGVNPQQTNEVCNTVNEEEVEVCNPATGEIITVPESEADNYLPPNHPDCQDEPVVARCVSLTANPANGVAPLQVSFRATSEASGGAKQIRYNFDYDNNGTIDDTGRVNGSSSIVGAHRYTQPGTYTAKVFVVFEMPDGSTVTRTSSNCEARVVVTEPLNPVAICTGLTANPTRGYAPLQVSFRATSEASGGAKQIRYNFDYDNNGTIDDTGRVNGSSSIVGAHRYTQPGTYTAKVFVVFEMPDGSTVTRSSADCEAEVVVLNRVTPQAACESLTAVKLSDRIFQFEARATTSDGAEVTGYTINYGDSATETVTSSANSQFFVHEYPSTDAEYTAQVTVHTSEGNRTSEACKAPVSVDVGDEFLTCVRLTADPNSGFAPLDVRLLVEAQASDGVHILGYAFDLDGDSVEDEVVETSEKTAAINHTFTDSTEVRAMVVGVDSSNNVYYDECGESITVEDRPTDLVCTKLDVTKIDRNTFRFVVRTEGDAEITKYRFEIDGTVTDQNGNTLVQDFEDGDHTIRVSVVHEEGATRFADCQANITVSPNPPELPNTGPAGALSVFFGTTAIGQGVRMWLASRKKLASILLSN